MSPSRLLLGLILIGVAAVRVPLAVARQDGLPARMDHKQLEAMAKALVGEAKTLEKAGKLDEARAKFLDAEGYLSTKDALDGIGRVREAEEKQAESALQEARADCTGANWAQCVAKLEKVLTPGLEK